MIDQQFNIAVLNFSLAWNDRNYANFYMYPWYLNLPIPLICPKVFIFHVFTCILILHISMHDGPIHTFLSLTFQCYPPYHNCVIFAIFKHFIGGITQRWSHTSRLAMPWLRKKVVIPSPNPFSSLRHYVRGILHVTHTCQCLVRCLSWFPYPWERALRSPSYLLHIFFTRTKP